MSMHHAPVDITADHHLVRDGEIVSDLLVFDTYEVRIFEETQVPTL